MKNYKDKILDFVYRYLICLIGIMIIALSFNLFYIPNNYVTGGITGLSIIFGKLANIDLNTFIIVANFFLIILSLLTLGFKKSLINILGAVTFNLFMYVTKDISTIINIHFSSPIFNVLCAGVCTGIGSGIVYKVNFTAGGSDILIKVINEKLKKPIGRTNFVINAIVITFGTFIFGIEMLINALIIKFIETTIIDKILIGISDSKMLLVYTYKESEVKDYLLKKIGSGVTILTAKGAYTKKNHNIIMCIVATDNYYKVKENIKEIDSEAFIIVSDCYEVLGGTKKVNILKRGVKI